MLSMFINRYIFFFKIKGKTGKEVDDLHTVEHEIINIISMFTNIE